MTSLYEYNNCLITPLQHIYQSRSLKLSIFFIIPGFVSVCVKVGRGEYRFDQPRVAVCVL